MTSVVQSSSSVYSTFISTIDHLPCDMVRSLWLVQACNLAVDKEKRKIHALLQQNPYQLQTNSSSEHRQEVAREFYESSKRISRWNNEALVELQNLESYMSEHASMLHNGIASLQKAASGTPVPVKAHSNQELRMQLTEHYEKHPLASQIKALQERALKDSGNVIIKQVPGRQSGIKIILKLSPSPRAANGLSGRNRSSSNTALDSQMSKLGRPRKSSQLANEARAAIKKRKQDDGHFEHATEPTAGSFETSVEPEVYCFCKQPSFGNMIGCDNEKCPNGDWFHYKCVGLLNRVEALKYKTQKWYCSESCKVAAESARKKRRKSRW